MGLSKLNLHAAHKQRSVPCPARALMHMYLTPVSQTRTSSPPLQKATLREDSRAGWPYRLPKKACLRLTTVY